MIILSSLSLTILIKILMRILVIVDLELYDFFNVLPNFFQL